MTTFNDREKAQENKYALDAEQAFKATARCNKLLGLWAAEKLGKTGDSAAAYAKDVVVADLESAGDDDVIAKLLADFAAANVAVDKATIKAEKERLLPIAREQILQGK